MKIILFSRRQLPHTAGEICQLFEAFRIFGFDYAVNEEFAPLAEELTGIRIPPEKIYGQCTGKQNKILTIEASGIGIACIVASCFHVPVVFAKKSKSVNIDGAVYVAEVESFTHKCKNQVIVSKKFLHPEDKVLIIDDFLANGCALQGLISIVTQAGATVEGIGIAVEKGFQQGGRIIRNLGYPLESLAIVESMDASNGTIVFREQEQ